MISQSKGAKVLRGDRCRCGTCGEHFTTTRNFDRHRRGEYPARVCLEPSAVGLVLNADGFWTRPGNGRIHLRANYTSVDLAEAPAKAHPVAAEQNAA